MGHYQRKRSSESTLRGLLHQRVVSFCCCSASACSVLRKRLQETTLNSVSYLYWDTGNRQHGGKGKSTACKNTTNKQEYVVYSRAPAMWSTIKNSSETKARVASTGRCEKACAPAIGHQHEHTVVLRTANPEREQHLLGGEKIAVRCRSPVLSTVEYRT